MIGTAKFMVGQPNQHLRLLILILSILPQDSQASKQRTSNPMSKNILNTGILYQNSSVSIYSPCPTEQLLSWYSYFKILNTHGLQGTY